MSRKLFLVGVVMLAMAAFQRSICAQSAAARLLFFNVKPGAKTQFEEAIKQQMTARRSQTGTWRWLAWEYVTGEVPRYCLASFGHAWADFDQSPDAAQAEEGRVAAAAALSSQPPVVQYFEHLEEVSDFGTSTNTPTMAEISVYQLHYGKNAQFYSALRELRAAIARSESGQRFEWFELRSGGEAPQFMLLVPRGNWASFDVSVEEFQERLEKVLGKKKTAQLFDQFASAVKTQQRNAVRLRPDLSMLTALEEDNP
jgi:hypothetical protein